MLFVQQAERQREHKAMIEAKERQREMAAEKRLTQMAAKDIIRKVSALPARLAAVACDSPTFFPDRLRVIAS